MGKHEKLVLKILKGNSDNNKAKAYQVKQIRNLILKYKLGGKL